MTAPNHPQHSGIPRRRNRLTSQVKALYANVGTDDNRREFGIALGDGIHADQSVRRYSSLLKTPACDLSRTDRLKREAYLLGSNLRGPKEFSFVVDLLVSLDSERSKSREFQENGDRSATHPISAREARAEALCCA